MDRLQWSHVIRRADVIDLDFVELQLSRRVSERGATRIYVDGGFARGFSLNPLFLEQMVSLQLPDSDRVPAMYAYLVSDPADVSTGVSWDAPSYAATYPESLDAPGGPLGHAWRRLRDGEAIDMGSTAHRRAVTRDRILNTARDGLRHASPARRPRTATMRVIIWGLGAEDRDGAMLAALASALESDDGEVLFVADSATPDDVLMAAAQFGLWYRRASLIDIATLDEYERGLHEGTLVIARAPGARFSAQALRTLTDAAESGPVQSLWRDPDGTIRSAGTVLRSGAQSAVLTGHPVEDLSVLPSTLRVSALDAPITAYRIGDRTAPRTLLQVHATSSMTAPWRSHAGGTDQDALARTTGRGLEFPYAGAAPSRRTEEQFLLPDGRKVPRLRWAIKTAAPAGERGESWGDTHFARGLAAALERLGQYAAVDAYAAARRPTARLDDVTLVLRGPEQIISPEAATTIQWIISHPDEITSEEVALFDLVYAASEPWAAGAATRLGREVRPLLQCTDATRFRPHGLERSADLVFVGTARGIVRPSVVEPLRAGAPLRVYGPDWRGYIPAAAIAGTHVPNDELPLVYESAGAVMNDHWPAMQKEGFVSNRLFDVVAAGGRAISDHVDGIEPLFGGAVCTYRNVDELHELVSSPLDALFPSHDVLARISERVRRDHSFDARAGTLLEDVLERRQLPR